jgi:hypothetical protein
MPKAETNTSIPRPRFAQAEPSTNGHHKAKGAPSMEERAAQKLGGKAAGGAQCERVFRSALVEAIVNNPGQPPELPPQEEPGPDFMADWRALGQLIAHLQHDTPARRELLKAAGLPDTALSSRQCATLAEQLLCVADEAQASDEFAWAKYPNEHREERPITRGLNTRRLCEVLAREVEWAWSQRVPLGNLTLISGDPGLGKTWMLIDWLARITTGRDMPDGSANPFRAGSAFCARREVLWVSAEDSDEDTIKPRFVRLGGDVNRFHSVRCVAEKKAGRSTEHTLDLSRHLGELEDWLTDHPLCVAVALDPLAAFLGKVDTHRNSDVRALLTPLKTLAERHRVAIIGNNHLSKGDGDNAMYRGMGSIAFNAGARSSWLVTPDPDQPKDRRLFLSVKGNLATEDVGGLAFRVGPEVEGGFLWEEGRVDATANDALAAQRPDRDRRAPARSEAKDWLRQLLADGPVSAQEVLDLAKVERLCEKTVRVAATELQVRRKKTGGKGAPWVWSLPQG